MMNEVGIAVIDDVKDVEIGGNPVEMTRIVQPAVERAIDRERRPRARDTHRPPGEGRAHWREIDRVGVALVQLGDELVRHAIHARPPFLRKVGAEGNAQRTQECGHAITRSKKSTCCRATTGQL